MPKGTEAPGYSLTLAGAAVPIPVPASGSTRAAGPAEEGPRRPPMGDPAGSPGATVTLDAPATFTSGTTAPTAAAINTTTPAAVSPAQRRGCFATERSS